MGEVVSDANGNFAFQLAQTSAKTYTVKWVRSSLAATVLSKDVRVGMTVAPVVKIDTDLFMTSNKTTDRRRYGYRLSGKIDPAMSGVPIALYYKTPSSSVFKLYRVLTASSTGTFTMWKSTTGTTSLGTWSWRARYAGDATHTSATAIVSVKIIR